MKNAPQSRHETPVSSALPESCSGRAGGQRLLTWMCEYGRAFCRETVAVAVTTTSMTYRVGRYAVALVRLRLANRALRSAQIALGNEILSRGCGDKAILASLQELQKQIDNTPSRPPRSLVATREVLLIQLVEALDSTADVNATPEGSKVLGARQECEDCDEMVRTARADLMPSASNEIRRIAAGYGTVLVATITIVLLIATTLRTGQDNLRGTADVHQTVSAELCRLPPEVEPSSERLHGEADRMILTGSTDRAQNETRTDRETDSEKSGDNRERGPYSPPPAVIPDVMSILEKAKTAAADAGVSRGRLLAIIAKSHHDVGDHEGYRLRMDESLRVAMSERLMTRTKAELLATMARIQREVEDNTGWMGTIELLRESVGGPCLITDACRTSLIIANEHALSGDRDEYSRAMETGLGLLKRCTDASGFEGLVVQTVEAMANAGDYDQAVRMAELVSHDMLSGAYAFGHIAVAMGREGLHTEALKTIRRIPRSIDQMSYLGALASVEADAGHLDDARCTAQMITRFELFKTTSVLFAKAWLCISDAQIKKGDMAGARESRKEAATAVRDVSLKAYANVNDLAMIAEARAGSGNREAYLSAIQCAEHALKKLGSDTERGQKIGGVVRARVRAGDYSQALELAESEQHPANRVYAYLQIIEALALRNDDRRGMNWKWRSESSPHDKRSVAQTSDRSPYLEQLLDDPTFGRVNRVIAEEVGNQLSTRELGIRLGTVNKLATKAGVTSDELLDRFQKTLAMAKSRGLSAVTALGVVSENLAWQKAYDDQK